MTAPRLAVLTALLDKHRPTTAQELISAVEAQAIDRAHRIGQDKPVFAYRMIALGTVEEKMQELQARKRALADALLSGSATATSQITEADLEALFAPLG